MLNSGNIALVMKNDGIEEEKEEEPEFDLDF